MKFGTCRFVVCGLTVWYFVVNFWDWLRNLDFAEICCFEWLLGLRGFRICEALGFNVGCWLFTLEVGFGVFGLLVIVNIWVVCLG